LNMKAKIQLKNVGLFELSPFSKYEIKGEGAYDELQRLCTCKYQR
jgi:4-methylaminobutanoate oxidase (formaldehyde-forming)